MLMFFLH